MSFASLLPLAQHTNAAPSTGGHGELVMTIMIVVVLSVIWTALGVVCWIFWRAKKREDAAQAEAEVEWRNAHSS
jgi:heme/copper-type cytochrome/quinol oxidase subunit 2